MKKVIKNNTNNSVESFPSLSQLEAELKREDNVGLYRQTFQGVLSVLIVISSVLILLAFIIFPFSRIRGNSMSPTFRNGEMVASLRGSSFDRGDIIIMSYNDKLLVRRVIAGPGDYIDLDDDGTVFVNSEQIEEPYLQEKVSGECDISLPFQVPGGEYFVMSDNRSTGQDSRNSMFGCVSENQIIGRAVFRFWPFDKFEIFNQTKAE